MELFATALLAITFGQFAFCQENAGTNLAPAIEECYNDTRFVTRNYRLPATITVLVDIIRKIEDGNPTQNARELSYEILHRFRQDGIRRTSKDLDTSQGLPYSPKGWEAYKNRLQLTKLTPGNAMSFNNDSLTDLQACSLHFMVSSTIETQTRNDESTVCNRIAQYTSRLQKRQAEFTETSEKSSCPIESGVIFTKWGAVKAGLIMAGIASGFESNPIKVTNGTIESTYASTIVGELSEVALNQATPTKTVGNKGGWNTTVEPKYYFLQNSDKDSLYLTDAEIRGGLDGLYLALNIGNWRSNSSDNIKISQILDLYYGRGVLNKPSRACNRKILTQALIDDDKLVQQTTLFNYLLDEVSQYGYTPNKANFPTMAKSAVESLRNYLKNNLQDLSCDAQNDVIERVSTDVLIFIDASWNYDVIQPLISYILENLDVNKYGTSYTVMDGINCDIIVSKSNSIIDFYEQYNRTQQQKYPTGFDFNKVIEKAETLFRAKLNNATDLTGQSTIVLMLPNKNPTTSQNEFVRNKKNAFKGNLPDFRIVVGGSGSKTSYNDLVTNPTGDIFIISDTPNDSSLKEAGSSIADRFKKIPRSIVNPQCGSSFSSDGSKNFEVVYNVEPSGINYHKISPNYFYDGQTLKIRGQGFGILTVCLSRTDANIRANMTAANCKNIDSDEFTTDISNYCTDESVVECSPIYISVQGVTSRNRCNDASCRFPDNIKYTISFENVKCSSNAKKLFSSVVILMSMLFLSFYFNL